MKKKKRIIQFLPNKELMKVLDFNFYYLTPVKGTDYVMQETLHHKCSILEALQYYCKSPHADLFSSHCSNCKIFIDGHNGEAAAYLSIFGGPEFIIAHTEGLTFDEEENSIPVMGVDIHCGNLSLSPKFVIQK